jgi:methylated-DNA-[protein]-cysteine S-methyltransferase
MRDKLHLMVQRIDSPIGGLTIAVDGERNLRAADFDGYEDRMNLLLRRHYGVDGFALEAARGRNAIAESIAEYFAGRLDAIDNISVLTGGTDFQREVWSALRRIPCGATWSYGELAARIGRPAAVRAVGLANGSNPIPVVVPCHRVIGANGTLTGYGGGLARKRWLLAHEGVELALGQS